MNNIRLRDFELGPIVNRDLSRRIRTVNGITVDRKVVRNDIKLAGDVVQDGVVGDDPHVHGGLGVVDVPVFLGLLPQVPLLIQIGNDFG